MSKLREVLSKASIALSWATHGHLTEDDAKECLEVVDAALAEPLKNCEVGTAEEQYARYCKSLEKDSGKSVLDLQGYYELTAKCFAHWAQMPYKKVK